MKTRGHLRRLERVWLDSPMYFVTTCVAKRRPLLANERVVGILRDEWLSASERHGWAVGSYVIMPDHVHFFCKPRHDAKRLSAFMAAWKQWTSKRMGQSDVAEAPIWQGGFFDHVLRSDESYSEKWNYVWQNPVRAGLVRKPDDWPHYGHIHFR